MWGFLRWCCRWLKKELVVFYIGWSIHWSRKSVASEINSYQRSVCISEFYVNILNFLSSSVIKNCAIVCIFLPSPQKGRKMGKGTALSRSVLKLFFTSAPEHASDSNELVVPYRIWLVLQPWKVLGCFILRCLDFIYAPVVHMQL